MDEALAVSAMEFRCVFGTISDLKITLFVFNLNSFLYLSFN